MSTGIGKKQTSLINKIKNSNNLGFKILAVIATAAAISNTIGFLANFLLHGIDIPTSFCGVCDILAVLFLFFGLRSKNYSKWGGLLLGILILLEFPLLIFAYGPVMYPYMILGFVTTALLEKDKHRIPALSILLVFDIVVIVLSTIFPYVFNGGNEPEGLIGSAIITYIVAVVTIVVSVVMWGKINLQLSLDNDSTTGAYSRDGFIGAVQRLISEEPNANLTLCYFDINGFKAANSVYGTQGGNKLLIETYELIKDSNLAPRLVGRVMGDHFICVCDTSNVNDYAIRDLSKLNFTYNGKSMTLKILCAIYEIKDKTISVSGMCDRIQHMSHKMRTGQSKQVEFYNDEIEESFQKETKILGAIELAIQNEEFEPYYQPIVDAKTKMIVSAESLARWNNNVSGLVSPGVFIPVLEEKGMITALDEIIIKKSRDFMEKRFLNKKKIVPISVNLSRVDFFDSELINFINHIVLNSSLPKEFHRMEVTESAYDAMPKSVMNTLSDFRKLGAKVLVDDFGVGYSSLGMITDYEFDIIKLDMKFAQKIGSDEKIKGVINSLIDLAHNLGGKVVAEGVETEEQYIFLRDSGCDFIQGYYFYKPMCEADFAKVLDEQT